MIQSLCAARRTKDEEAGFTLVEVLIAMIITLIVMTVLMFAVVSTLKIVVQARERQTATALATQVLEQMRALPSATVIQSDGAAPTADFSGGSPSAYTFVPPASLLSGVSTESLVVNNPASTQPSWPGSGQSGDVVVGNVTYEVASYVTRPTAVIATEEYSLTAIVSWTSTAFPDGRTVAQRSVIFTGGECLSSGTSPYAAPCQGFFTARAGPSSGGLSVTEPFTFDPLAPPEPDRPAVLDLVFTGLSTSSLLEQTASGSTLAVGAGANRVTASPASSGGVPVPALVDSDPSSTASPIVSVPLTSHTSGSLSSSSPLGTLSVSHFGGGSRSAAAIAADATLCKGAGGAALTTGPAGALRPCSSGDIQPTGSSSLSFTPVTVDPFTIATFNPGSRDRAVSAVLAAANPGVACTAGGTPSCAHAFAERSMGTVTLGAGATGPAGYDPSAGLWSVTGFAEAALAEEGDGSRPPAFTRTGSVQVWTEISPGVAGYQTVGLGVAPAGSVSYPVPLTTLVYGTATVAFKGVVTIQPWTLSDEGPADCIADTCVSNAGSSASVSAVMTVTVTDGPNLTRFTLSTDLGGLMARASYKAVEDA